MRVYALICCLGLTAYAATARAADKPPLAGPDTCLPDITAAEHQFVLPTKLLQTIGIVESGRIDPATGRVAPWPWTINAGGVGHYFETKTAAVQAVQDLQAAGVQSIDVGCMQINLMHHPNAFASLDEAFDPGTNARYGARFLSALYHEIGSWPQAAAAYHSRTENEGADYEARIMAIWPLAGRFPDVTLAQRGRMAVPGLNLANYTPELAAEARRTHAEYLRLALMSGPIGRPAREPAKKAGADYRGYTPAVAAQLRQTAHLRSHAPAQPASRRPL
jgi:hypothetical protein